MIFTYHTATNRRGFSLVEVLVAISLLLIALVGPMTYLTRTSQNTEVANQRVIATFLAQEGIELVHKMRDDAILVGFPAEQNTRWNNFISQLNSGGCFTTTGCSIEISNTGSNGTTTVAACSGNEPCRLYRRENIGTNRTWYTYTSAGNDLTPYTRTIRVQSASESVRELYVTSEVTWRTSTFLRTNRVESTTSVFNIFYEL